ncbi:MAG: ribosome maturation factor RimP [Actinomycetota bacterium]|jgi:ribosome maturation factor RimP|nr:ribosome maturation factor RimP [Actinomycetota bacterium]
MTTMIERVEQLVTPMLDERGLQLYDVEHVGGTLRVLVDGPSGVDLDLLAQITRQLSSALDTLDPVPGRYTLEVSSPGLERPLRRPAHFSAAIGTHVRIKTRPGTDGERRVEGVLVAADEEAATIEAGGACRRLDYDDIERAQTVFDWQPAGPRPTPSRGGSRRKATTP